MKCPGEECGNRDKFVVYTRLRCATSLSIDEGELVVGETKTKEVWNSVEPESVVCSLCGNAGKPEEFGLYSGKFLKAKLIRLISETIGTDGVGALPEQIMDLVLPQGGVLIHKEGTTT